MINWSGVTSLITAFTAVGALIFTALSLNATRDQVAVTEQGQYTDRYSRAIEQLGRQGPDQLQIRLGGIYALERLAHDSPRDQPTILAVLATFVRTSTASIGIRVPAGGVLVPVGGHCPAGSPGIPDPDVEAALRVVGRRDSTYDNDARIDLSYVCLQGANLSGANLVGTDFSGANLVGANLDSANLAKADLGSAYVRLARLDSAVLTGANLVAADLAEADLTEADLTDTDLTGANLTSANLNGANLTNVSYSSETLIRNIQTDAATKGAWW